MRTLCFFSQERVGTNGVWNKEVELYYLNRGLFVVEKIIITFALFVSLLASSAVFALQSTPIVCPESITCDYDTGICNTPAGWTLDTGRAEESFSDSQTMNLSKIWAYKTADKIQSYQFECEYGYGNYSAISTYTYVKDLEGPNWIFSGFGKQKADCSNPLNPSTCRGEN